MSWLVLWPCPSGIRPLNPPTISPANPTVAKYLIDLGLWALATLLAYAFRKPALINLGIPLSVWGYTLLSVSVMAAMAWRYHLPRQTWQRVGVPDLMWLARAVALATLVVFACGFIFQSWLQLPRSVPLLAGMLGFLMMGGVRMLARILGEQVRQQSAENMQ